MKLFAPAAKAPPANASVGKLVVVIKDRQGSLSRIERLLQIGEPAK